METCQKGLNLRRLLKTSQKTHCLTSKEGRTLRMEATGFNLHSFMQQICLELYNAPVSSDGTVKTNKHTQLSACGTYIQVEIKHKTSQGDKVPVRNRVLSYFT